MNTHIHLLLAAVSPPTSYVLIFLGILASSAVISWIVFRLLFGQPAPRDFVEPEDDARIEIPAEVFGHPSPELVRVKPCDEALPPHEVLVHRWTWNPERGCHDYVGTVPLSGYPLLVADPAADRALADARKTTWEHKQLFPCEARPVHPCGTPLDCALGASPLPAAGEVF